MFNYKICVPHDKWAWPTGACFLRQTFLWCGPSLDQHIITGLFLYHFDPKKAGESLTRPDIRVTPIRDSYGRLVRTVLEARNPQADETEVGAGELQPGEMALILDGGKHGNKSKLTAPWKKEKDKNDKNDDDDADDDIADDDENNGSNVGLVPSVLHINKTEESITAWRSRNRSSTLGIKQMELAHILSAGRIALPVKNRKHYKGTNCGDTISDVAIPRMANVWQLPWKSKKLLYGKKHLIAVGGKTAGANGDQNAVKRTDTTVEPVCFHPMPEEFYETIVDDFHVKRVFDLVVGDAVFAYVCLCKRLGYIGICFTNDHENLVMDHLLETLKVDMADFQHPLYNPTYAAAVGAGPTTGTGKATAAQATGKAKAKGNAKAKSKKALKPPKQVANGDEDGQVPSAESEAFSGEDEEEVWDPLKED